MIRTMLLLSALVVAGSVRTQTPTPEITRDLRGVVEGTEGRPARVIVWRNDMRRASADPLCDGRTAADGSFSFSDVPWLQGFDWGFNTMVAVARTKGRAGLLQIRGDAVALDQLVVKLVDTVDLHGVVHDAGGKPIAGAWVWPSIFGEMTDNSLPQVWVTSALLPWRVATDADGRFTVKGLPSIAPIHVQVEHDEFAREKFKVPDPSKPCKVELVRGGKISGVVAMPDGQRAVRVTVCAAGRGIGYGRTITDENGSFCLTGLGEDIYKIWAEVPDLTVIAVADLEVTPGGHIENQQVRLVAGGFIVGRIVDAATGQPVKPGPHTDVAMYGPARPRGGACECTPVLSDGTFRIRAPAGSNFIYLRAPPAGWSEESADVEVVEGEETVVEWRVRTR